MFENGERLSPHGYITARFARAPILGHHRLEIGDGHGSLLMVRLVSSRFTYTNSSVSVYKFACSRHLLECALFARFNRSTFNVQPAAHCTYEFGRSVACRERFFESLPQHNPMN